jgi:hypothetical protein
MLPYAELEYWLLDQHAIVTVTVIVIVIVIVVLIVVLLAALLVAWIVVVVDCEIEPAY